jgi:hypothetical protein
MIGAEDAQGEMVYETHLNAFDRIAGVRGFVGHN